MMQVERNAEASRHAGMQVNMYGSMYAGVLSWCTHAYRERQRMVDVHAQVFKKRKADGAVTELDERWSTEKSEEVPC